ncbi:MAG: ABC-F family ATP-binding cassette domain-containing protein [Syntrophobacteraceae bacterium]
MLTVQNISKSLGKKDLFLGVSFHINAGERIGLIGPNGAGKTTLFHLLLEEALPDSGAISHAKHVKIGYLPQQWVPIQDRTILSHVTDIDQAVQEVRTALKRLQALFDHESDPATVEAAGIEHARLLERLEHLGGYDLEARAAKILAGLGFRENGFNRAVSALSGGWIMRVELARLLLSEPDLMLLDEPTNHLDLDTLLWLEQYLLSSPSAMIIIAHDRAFLNRVVTRILELEQGRLQEYSGNYDAYLDEKARRQEIHLASFKNQQERLRQIERFIERNRYRKDRARQVQSRIKALDKVERIDAPTETSSIRFNFPEPARCGKRVLELQNVHKAYGDHVVYSGIDLVVQRGDRMAFLGPNGAGKSTLLKMLAGIEPVNDGLRQVGHQVVTGYYAQHQWELLRGDCTVLDEAASIAGDLPQTQIRSLLGAFLFPGDDVLKRVSVLSGGEKARLTLCKLLLQRPNVLLLDEPTNHLDIPSRAVLEEALEDYPGALCFISHDRHFINAIATSVLVAEKGAIHLFPGNYDDYLSIWRQRLEQDRSSGPDGDQKEPKEADQIGTVRTAQEKKRLEAEWRNELYRLKAPLQKRVQNLEARLDAEHRQLDQLKERLAAPETYRDGTDLKDLNRDYQQCQKRAQDLTTEWEERALELEELELSFWKDKEKAI